LKMGLVDSLKGLIQDNPIAAVGTAAAVGVATGVGAAAVVGAVKKRKRKKISHTRRGLRQDRKRKSKQPWEVSYRRRKKKGSKKGSRRIHYARKTGQPYILLANGQAKFIKGKRRKR